MYGSPARAAFHVSPLGFLSNTLAIAGYGGQAQIIGFAYGKEAS